MNFEIDAAKFKGVKNNLFIAVTSATNFYVDAWQFTEAGSTGISEVSNGQTTKSQSFDLSGRRIDSRQQRGIVIEQYTDENGVKHTRKHIQ